MTNKEMNIAADAIYDFLKEKKENIKNDLINTLKNEIDNLTNESMNGYIVDDLRNTLNILDKIDEYTYDEGSVIWDWIYEHYEFEEEKKGDISMKKMYVVLNEDIEDIMKIPGYACSQVGHATFDVLDSSLKDTICWTKDEDDILSDIYTLSNEIDNFRFNGNKIIILKTNQNEMDTLKELGYISVIDRDKGGILTAINLGIYDEEKVPEFIKKMKLY